MFRHLAIACVVSGVCLSGVAMAQTLRPQLDLDTALKVQAGCIAFARDKNLKMSIAVYDYSGRLISAAHMDGARTSVSGIAHWKGKSAAIFQRSTEETASWNTRDVPDLATIGGGVPIFDAQGNALGGIGVSGASVPDDIACATAGIEAAGMSVKAP